MSQDRPDYIFCPLCGSTDWNSDKTRSVASGRLTVYKCKDCKKFEYTNIQELIKHEFLVGVTQTTRYSEKAEIERYHITVWFKNDLTDFQDADTMENILSIKKCLEFNWYSNEEVVEKVKKYLVFS